jgi:hypothetical protein
MPSREQTRGSRPIWADTSQRRNSFVGIERFEAKWRCRMNLQAKPEAHPARLRFAVVAIICRELVLRRKYTTRAEPAADIERLS